MLTKFDSKSNRVKGLSFHPKRPWVLASLHNGVIQLWDYRMGTLLDRFEEHEGPVRGIDFHRSQPLFVSGGDDYKIKVWNYKLRRCLFTLLGHLDYIRTVQFHHEYPWIVSASDDQTIRLWNWQSRTCISVLTGHNHYVMCAQFHPRDDLIVSASLDQTVRVWDVTGLRRKTVRGAPGSGGHSSMDGGSAELFGANDAVVKYVLEGHDRGVNWASFHPTQNLIVSGADDRSVKLWRMSDSKAWEMDTLRGHSNNVSCVVFHPRHDLVISNSEDRSIRVWDVQKRMCIATFRREADRFWMLCVHPEQNLIAAGHDSGMVVFKLERERPAYSSSTGQLFYIKDRYLRRAVLGTGSDVPLMALRSAGRSAGSALGMAPRVLTVNGFNPSEDNVLVTSAVDGGTFEMYTVPASGSSGSSSQAEDPVRGQGLAAVFTARNKYAVLDKTRSIVVRGFGSDPGKKVKPPYSNADMLFPSATPGRVLVKAEDRICLFELQSRRQVAELAGVAVKYVVWSPDGTMVALLGKHAVVLADKDLTQVCSVTETVRVKSGAWDEHGVFIYTTLNHVKYLLPVAGAGEAGIVRTLDQPVYAAEARGGNLYVVDRDAKIKALAIDATEHLFKLALARRQFDRVLNIIKSARLCGQAVIAYLQKAGYPEIALLFVEDDTTRFNLALQCGNLDIALKAAKAINSEECWHRLAAEAMKVGSIDLTEVCYQASKALERLSFLYTITGNKDKMGKMMSIASVRGDTQSRFHNALLVGDAGERVKVLEAAGQTALAYLTAATHGLEADAERIKGYLEQAGLPVPPIPAKSKPLQPSVASKTLTGSIEVKRAPSSAAEPTKKQSLDLAAIAAAAARLAEEQAASGTSATAASAADRASAAAAQAVAAAQAAAAAEEEEERAAAAAEKAAAAAASAEAGGAEGGDGGAGWAVDLDLGLPEEKAGKAGAAAAAGGGGWGDDDLELDFAAADADAASSAASAAAASKGTSSGDGFVMPSGGSSVPSLWVSNSTVAGDHVAAGSFETAMTLLNRQIGLKNFEPLKPFFMAVYLGARAATPTLPHLSSVTVYSTRNAASSPPPGDKTLPAIAVTLAGVKARLNRVHEAFTEGKFSECRDVLDALFAMVPLVVVDRKEDVADLKAIIKAATEYKLAVRIMQTAKTHDQGDGARQMELAAYMTHCALEPPHLLLALNLAMRVCYKWGNFILAAGFARRLMEVPEANSAKNAKLLGDAKKVLTLSEAQARNAVPIAYDASTPFAICAASLTPVPRGGEVVKSPYCGASYSPKYKGSVCVVDGMAAVGVETLGLVSMVSSSATQSKGK